MQRILKDFRTAQFASFTLSQKMYLFFSQNKIVNYKEKKLKHNSVNKIDEKVFFRFLYTLLTTNTLSLLLSHEILCTE